jgi:hypothetical protein
MLDCDWSSDVCSSDLTPQGAKAAADALKKVDAGDSPLAASTAKLVLGLLESNADGIAFLQKLVP